MTSSHGPYQSIATATTREKNAMGIKKRIIEELIYTCDANGCNNTGENPKDFTEELTIQLGTAVVKKKVVLCVGCRAHLIKLQKMLLTEEEIKGVAPVEEDYDPQTYPQMQKLTPEDRTKHHQAKVWALGPDSTITPSNRPGGVRGPAGEKILTAYEEWLKEQEIRAEIERRAKEPAPA